MMTNVKASKNLVFFNFNHSQLKFGKSPSSFPPAFYSTLLVSYIDSEEREAQQIRERRKEKVESTTPFIIFSFGWRRGSRGGRGAGRSNSRAKDPNFFFSWFDDITSKSDRYISLSLSPSSRFWFNSSWAGGIDLLHWSKTLVRWDTWREWMV